MALAKRVLANPDYIDARAPKWGEQNANGKPYSDTHPCIDAGVLIFPHERTPDALGDLIAKYENIADVLTIRYTDTGTNKVRIGDADDASEIVDPNSLSVLPRLLRNSFAHFNIRPLEKDGRFGGVQVWNRMIEMGG